MKGGNTTNFTYDNAGNLLSDNKAQYIYDAFNHMERVETFDGHVQINRYDAEGLRHEMEEDGKLVQFIFQGDEIVTEEKENNIIRFIRGYELIASDAESARTYYHYASDEMGSITHLVEGNVVCNHYEYDAWGNTTVCEETVENRFQFNGQQYDAITQQYYLRARFYNPVIARFTQEDTYWGDGLNLYAYCRNNPVHYEDPSGHWCEKKQDVYNRLLQERHLTEKDLIDNPDLKLQLMAEASNIVKKQKTNSLHYNGNGTWTSNAGLIYGQGSVHGNRVKYVLAHTVPDNSKPVHTVFNVDRTNVIGLVDEAWVNRIGTGTRQSNGNRVYNINMGRVIGTNGETTIRIVVDGNTTNIVSAFPV